MSSSIELTKTSINFLHPTLVNLDQWNSVSSMCHQEALYLWWKFWLQLAKEILAIESMCDDLDGRTFGWAWWDYNREFWLSRFAKVLGCKVGTLPTTYLGPPLGAPYKSGRVWEGVEELFQKRLALWKKQYLSKGGRQTLIKSTWSSLPIYFMSLFVITKRVVARLEKIQRDFLWGWRN